MKSIVNTHYDKIQHFSLLITLLLIYNLLDDAENWEMFIKYVKILRMTRILKDDEEVN